MPTYRTRIINRDFAASSDVDLPNPQRALAQALTAALEIGSEEIRNGNPFFGAEVRVECDGETLSRLVIAIGVSPLQ
jgi:hypothetical protein